MPASSSTIAPTLVENSFNIPVKYKKQYTNQQKNTQEFDCLCSQQINALINKFWVLLCLLLTGSSRIFIFPLYCDELQLFVYVVVTKEFIDDLFSVNTPSLSSTEMYINHQVCLGRRTAVLVSYDYLFYFFLISSRTKLFFLPWLVIQRCISNMAQLMRL